VQFLDNEDDTQKDIALGFGPAPGIYGIDDKDGEESSSDESGSDSDGRAKSNNKSDSDVDVESNNKIDSDSDEGPEFHKEIDSDTNKGPECTSTSTRTVLYQNGRRSNTRIRRRGRGNCIRTSILYVLLNERGKKAK